MFIQVKLLNGFPEPLLYQVPEACTKTSLKGALVTVPLKQQKQAAWVIEEYQEKPAHITFAIKEIISVETFPADTQYLTFINQLANYYCIDPIHFIRRIRHFLAQKAVDTDVYSTKDETMRQVPMLTNEQLAVFNFLAPRITNPAYTPTLLHGVTGSGKTEIYKQLIIEAIKQHKTALLLLPEVTLALQFEKLLRAQLPSDVLISSFHSATSPKEKRILWQSLIEQKPLLIIGVHLPILLPIPNLGVIIVDEEHETGYQEKKHPKVNTKEAAILRAHINQIPILLGSATPSVSSLHQVKQKGWHLFELKKRFAGAFPQIKTVLLTDKKERRNFWISKELEQAIKERLAKKEQTIIYINRRGYSFFVQCKNCSFIFGCPSCSVSLTLHDNGLLHCHYCAYYMQLPNHCTSCKQSADQFIKKGIGTQQAVTILEKLFPQAHIARADLDTSLKKKEWQQTVHDFQQGKIHILVGTQTITKGYHFPNVTLVGVLWADLSMNIPLYNAGETTLQKLIQVAGRAGRQRQESLVIVQAMADYPLFAYLHEQNYLQFYDKEIELRSEVLYPPCIRLSEIEIKSKHEQRLDKEAEILVDYLMNIIETRKLTVTLLGPSKPPVHMIKDIHIRKIYLKGHSMQEIAWLFNTIKMDDFYSQIYFTPNPLC
ncbi:MAG: primosomal protein N' [Candidatus Dependentiae bacterium]|nr:primosomal protein N' [Candidatus Dependentiae bacterium]